MEVFDQFVDPSTVSHSLVANFSSIEEMDLIVVKNTLLQVFRTVSDKLVLLNEFKLQGQVIGIEKLKLKGSLYDRLAILTKFAKLSVISYDLDKGSIETQSLHFYELEFKQKQLNDISEASLKIDPNFRAALCFHMDILAFLPFNTDDDLDMDAGQSTEFILKSTIIPSSKLDASIHDIIECEFLHDYRDPTLAIIYNDSMTWAADLSMSKDTVNLVVLNLDLTTGSSTPIINLEKLPYDIWSIKSLPSNGFLLIGCNEIIHVDNSGNTRGIGVNEYYKECTDYRLEDQSELNIFLEDCRVESVGSSVLIVDKFGALYTLSFEKDGKVIKKIQLVKSPSSFPITSPISISNFNDYLFVGNSTSDSLLLKSKTIVESNEDPSKDLMEDEDEEEDYDELYGTSNRKELTIKSLDFEIVDKLINNGPIASFTLARLSPESSVQGLSNPNYDDLSIVAANGEGSCGKITCFNPTLQPKVHSTLKFQNISRCWNLLNRYLITTDLTNFKSEIFLINENFKNFQTLGFKNNNITINIGVFEQTKRIVQVSSSNLYIFDYNFKKLLQMNADFEILHAKLLDPYVILTSANGEIRIFEVDSNGFKLNKIKLPKSLSDIILTYGTISCTNLLNSRTKRSRNDDTITLSNPVFLVTTVNNQILAFRPNHNDEVYQFKDIHKLIELSEVTPFENPEGLVPDPFFKQIELLPLGDEIHKEEILTILTIGGEVLLYKLLGSKFKKLEPNVISGAPENIYPQSTVLERKLIPFNAAGKSCLFVTGKQPYVIIKTCKSNPKIFKFTHTSLISLCAYEDKFMSIDDEKNARICSIPFDSKHDYTNNLPTEIFSIGKTVNNVSFHETSNLLIASTLTEIPYDPKDEEGNPIVGTEDKRRASSYKSSILLIKPTSWSVLDELEFEDEIVVNSLKSLHLTVSSRSKKKKEFLVLGTAKYRMEDLTVLGAFQLYDVISIVPDPQNPEVDYKLKEIVSEVVKGGVTAVTEISGRFLVSQGQKVLIRDLQQDNSTVPVAFLDTPTTLSDAKSFENLVLVSDTLKNIMFLGFDAEPYRLLLLGKSLNELNVSSCDFLVSSGEIHFLVADDEGTLHLVSYDPDDPKSLSGQRLLNKTTFHINTLTTTMRLVPKHEEFKNTSDSFQVIGANTDGSLFKITPIDDQTYRRFYILQQQLSDKLPQYCGLNAKANRYQFSDSGVRPIIDYELIRRFVHLNVEKRHQYSGKVGKRAYLEIWRDIIEIENTLKNLHE
jgi:cleavage and polyadenylation specificity factor subunit 1